MSRVRRNLLHKIAFLLLSASLTVAFPSMARAFNPDCGAQGGGDGGSVEGQCDGNDEGSGGSGGGGNALTFPYQYLFTFSENNGTSFCTKTGYVANEEAATARTSATELSRIYYVRILGYTQSATCPADPLPPDIPTSVTEAVSLRIRESHQLPVPTLTVTPTQALAGLPVYLTIGGASMEDFDLLTQVRGRTIHVHVTSQYDVDWGDGESVITISQGGSYPNGDVKHSYNRVGSFTLSVRQEWVATWRADNGASGTITGLLTQASAPPLVVDQAEAVGVN